MGNKITLDYDDIIGGFVMVELAQRMNDVGRKVDNTLILEYARMRAENLFYRIEQWQQSGKTLRSFENEQ